MAELERDNARLRDEVAAAEALLLEQESVQSELRARLAELEQRLEQAVAPRDAAAQEILTCDTAHCNEQCPSFDLCRKRVLIVGGIERCIASWWRREAACWNITRAICAAEPGNWKKVCNAPTLCCAR